jgi:hypothetical protein
MQALVVAIDPVLRPVAETLRGAGFDVAVVESADEAARRTAPVGLSLAIIGDGAKELQPFASLPIRVRRRVVVVQVGDGVTTADGATAFVRGVNLVVATADLGRIGDIARAAIARHRDLVAMLEPELAQ